MEIKIIISVIILFVFSLLGVFVGSMIVHENIHKLDYSNIPKMSEEMCYLDSNWEGYYKFSVMDEQMDAISKIDKYTDVKAYSSMFIVGIIYLLAYAIVFNYISEKMILKE